MKTILLSSLLGLLGLNMLQAQPTFSEDIAPIIYNNCTSCHRSGEIGPFPLTNYNEVASWASMIQYVTEIGYMPPWKPDREYSSFVGESGLNEQEIQLIADWVNAGSPQGDPSLEPPLPNFPSGSQLGTPDTVLTMAEEYIIPGNNEDEYRVFVLPTGLTEDKEIAAIEFRPGNTKAVHHALIAYEINGQAAALDAQSPGYGYEAFGDFGVPTQGNFTGYTPGIQSVKFPEGIGSILPAGADLLIQVHYAPLPSTQTDRSSLNIFFKDTNDTISREVQRVPITPFDLPGSFPAFSIPPNTVKSFHGTKTVDEDISLISVYPHCHYLGKDWEIYAIAPNGDTIPIIRIDEWDFNWQGAYTFQHLKKVPAGSVLHVKASYDNTTNNPYNPNNPPQSVGWGEGTADEMYLVGMNYVLYQDGDENILVGGGSTTNLEEVHSNNHSRLYTPFPNPAKGETVLSYYLHQSQNVAIELFDVRGKLVKTLLEETVMTDGAHRLELNTQAFSEGVYTIRLRNTERVLSTSSLMIIK